MSIEWSVCVPESNDGRYCRPQSIGCVNNEESAAENVYISLTRDALSFFELSFFECFFLFQTESTTVSLDLCLNAQFHVCGSTHPFMNPIYDGGAARAVNSCQWSNASSSSASCGDNVEVRI